MTDKAKSTRKAAFWNMLGSGVNAAATMVLTVLTSWLGGIEASGVLGLAFGVCFIFYSLASFEVRAYQSTDLEEHYSFHVYLGTRLTTSLFSWIACAGYLLYLAYTPEKALTVFLICSFKILEAVADVFQGDFQQKEHLEYAGQSLFFRNVLGCALYLLCYAVTRNLVLSAGMMVLASLLCLIFFDRRIALRFETSLRPSFRGEQMLGLIRECWPLALSSFMAMYVLNAAKIQVDRIHPELSGYWIALFMPASFANLFGTFAFRPLVTTLRDQWNRRQLEGFMATSGKLTALILLGGAIITLGGALLGTQVLGLLYHISLEGRRLTLILILTGGTFHALTTFLWYLVIVVRKQKYVILADGAAFLFSLAAVPGMIRAGGLEGAAWSYLCSTILRVAVLSWIVLREVHKAKQNLEEEAC